MNKDFIPYNEALALKELGFEEPCFACYSEQGELTIRLVNYRSVSNNTSEEIIIRNFNSYENGTISAPTFSKAFRFFREKYNLDCNIALHVATNGSTKGVYFEERSYKYQIRRSFKKPLWIELDSFKTYEQAELESLKELIKIVLESLKELIKIVNNEKH